MNALILLVTRDRDLIEGTATSSEVESPTVEYVDHLSEATARLNAQDPIQALVVDLSRLDKNEIEALQVLMRAAPNMPVLVVGTDDDLTRHSALLTQGAQDLLPKGNLNGCGLQRAVRNATARKAREIAVYNNNERARVTLASIGDAVLSTDSNWLVSFINPTAEKLTGWTCTQAVGRHVSEVFHVLDGITRAPIALQMELAIQKGRTIILPPNCVLVRRSGQELHIEDSAAPIHDLTGEFAGMVVVFHDVSESRAPLVPM